jgi:hypothetical protein
VQELGVKEKLRPRQSEVTKYCRIIHDRTHTNFYLSPNIIKMIELRRLSHARHVACIV